MDITKLAGHVDAATLRAIAAKAGGAKARHQASLIAALAPYLLTTFLQLRGTTSLTMAHFLAQIAHESDSFCTTEEYANGAAYEGRADLGNVKTGDGVRFKGRGLIQLTGRTNYVTFTAWMQSADASAPNFVNDPDAAGDFPWAILSAVWFWNTRNLSVLAERDDLIGVTKIINGGRNGLADRRIRLSNAKAELARIAIALTPAKDGDRPSLRRGSEGPDVEIAQRALAVAGHYLLAIDGDFGSGTEGAVKTLQRARGLVVDGWIGPKTWSVLEPFIEKEDP